MNDPTQVEHERSTKSDRALVPITREQTKALVVSAIKSVLADTGQSIGVSSNWLIKHAEQLMLKQDEVETLVMVRTEFSGLLPHAVKFLYQGLSAQDVYGCYRAQRSLAVMEYSASVKKIAMLIRAFAEADPDNEGLDEMIIEAHKVISERYFWVKYVDQSIYILCVIAREYGCATIDAALSMIDSRRPKRAGMLPDDDEGEGSDDDVERHRAEFEATRNYC